MQIAMEMDRGREKKQILIIILIIFLSGYSPTENYFKSYCGLGYEERRDVRGNRLPLKALFQLKVLSL